MRKPRLWQTPVTNPEEVTKPGDKTSHNIKKAQGTESLGSNIYCLPSGPSLLLMTKPVKKRTHMWKIPPEILQTPQVDKTQWQIPDIGNPTNWQNSVTNHRFWQTLVTNHKESITTGDKTYHNLNRAQGTEGVVSNIYCLPSVPSPLWMTKPTTNPIHLW